jgi:hypothetical protein
VLWIYGYSKIFKKSKSKLKCVSANLSLFFVRSLSTKLIQYSEDVYYSVRGGVMHERNLDHEILKLMEAQPDIKEGEIASKLSVPE